MYELSQSQHHRRTRFSDLTPTSPLIPYLDKVTYNHRKDLNGDNGRPTFLEAYFAGCQVLITSLDFYDLSMSYFSRCAKMNVRYCEPFFDTQAHTERGISAATVLDGYMRAQRDAVGKYGVRSTW